MAVPSEDQRRDGVHLSDGVLVPGEQAGGMQERIRLAATSRDSHLALRRVERQQALIEMLHHAGGVRKTLPNLARTLHVSVRAIARDVDRLRDSGIPISVTRGRAGGVLLTPRTRVARIQFDVPELAALMSSLAVLGPTVSDGASSAMRKLTAALREDRAAG